MVQVKDFEYKWIWQYSRISGEGDGYYIAIYKGQDIGCGRRFRTKKDAQKFVSRLVKYYKTTHKA